jgi:hypothetical protein
VRRSRSFLVIGMLAVGNAAALSGCGAAASSPKPVEVVNIAADYPDYSSAEQIIDTSDLVVQVQPVSSRVETLQPDVSDSTDPLANPQAGVPADQVAQIDPVVVTVSTVKIVDVVKGAANPGDLIEVSQLGGVLNGVQYVEADTTTLSPATGTDYVLMLAAHGADDPYDLVNPVQGMYEVNTADELSPVQNEGALPIESLTDLRSLVD